MINIVNHSLKLSGFELIKHSISIGGQIMSLKVDNLSHWYADEDQRLYENINLEFEDGNFYSIVGESGSGKKAI